MRNLIDLIETVQPVRPAELQSAMVMPEPGYLYHATNEDNAMAIAHRSLVTHTPGYGTGQQTSWPDGATERRSYFTRNPQTAKSFAPAEGRGVLIRVRSDAATFRAERSTGDIYARQAIPAAKIEYLGIDDAWYPIRSLRRTIPPDGEIIAKG